MRLPKKERGRAAPLRGSPCTWRDPSRDLCRNCAEYSTPSLSGPSIRVQRSQVTRKGEHTRLLHVLRNRAGELEHAATGEDLLEHRVRRNHAALRQALLLDVRPDGLDRLRGRQLRLAAHGREVRGERLHLEEADTL